MILLDTSGLLAWIDAGQRQHAAVAAAMAAIAPPFVLSPFVLAEIDYLLAERVGPVAEQALLAEIEGGAFELPAFDAADIGAALRVIERYSDLRSGLADAAVVVLSERYLTLALISLDERHFRTLRGHRGRPFELIPQTR